MLYFAYGSNMSSRRLRVRVPSARFITVATLRQHVLAFHKIGKNDGSGKCDIAETSDFDHKVIGVAYDIAECEKRELDRAEGLHFGYEEKPVVIATPEGKALYAASYYATSIDSSLKPYHWYKEHVLRGAMEHGLPDLYIAAIAAIKSVTDPNQQRQDKELRIYC